MFLSGKFVFIILALVGGAGLCLFPDWLEDNVDLNERIRKWIVIAAGLLWGIALICSWVFLDPGRITQEKLAYQNSSYDTQFKIEVLDIVKEQGKEAVYILDIPNGYDDVEVPESIYQSFIGEGNHAVTVHFETVTMYVSNSIVEHKFDTSTSYIIKRLFFPWENIETFSNAEISEFKDLLLNKKSRLNKADFSFAIDQYSIGSCHSNCLDHGAVRINDGV